jgi:SAM-dependent methyltransferase
MSPSTRSAEEFYSDLFTEDTGWSGLYPNPDEVKRLGVILDYLSEIRSAMMPGIEMHLLDFGCGRGWLTNLIRGYGVAEGLDPVSRVVQEARARYPSLTFYEGSAATILSAGRAGSFDAVVATEVIEHVPRDSQSQFVCDVGDLLRPGGYAIITTPRGDYYRRAKTIGYAAQPIEEWLTEHELRHLFEVNGFRALTHRRIYMRYPRLSPWHRLAASYRGQRVAEKLGIAWALEGLRYKLGFYQAWLFQKA